MLAANQDTFPWDDQEHAPCEDWTRLVGCLVEIHLFGDRVAAGTVDVVSPEGDLIWIAAHGADTRKLYDKPSGFEVWITEAPNQAHPTASPEAGAVHKYGPFLDIKSAWPEPWSALGELAGQPPENPT